VIATATDPLTSRLPAVGRTPLVRLEAFEPGTGVEIHAKLELRNPGGSVKDRAAVAIILDALRAGHLRSGRTLLDATSGNTGVAYAMVGAALGLPVHLCVPSNVTGPRKRLLEAYGATVTYTDPMDGTDGAIREARWLAKSDPGRYFYADQYSNPANWRAHYAGTAPELVEQTGGRLTHFVAGLGTSGTFIGTGRRLREWRPSVRLISVGPDSPLHGLEGLKHMPTAMVPPIYDPSLADRHETVETEEALELARHLARRHGLLVGPSSGAALVAAVRAARTLERGVVVTVFPDNGERYLTETTLGVISRASAETTPDVVAVIRAHAARAYPDECCGALLGTEGRISEAWPIENAQFENRQRRFLIGPEAYRRAEAHAAATSRALLGFYHSHPDHPAVPSSFDLEHAWPNLVYAIVSVRQGEPHELRAWRLRPDRSGFSEEPLQAGAPVPRKDL
jgi:cysteine synthase B